MFAFLAGLLLAACFPGIELSWLAWLAPGLILWSTRSAAGKSVFLSGFAAGLGCFLLLLHWLLFIPFRFYALVAYLGTSALLALDVAAWCWVCWRVFPREANWRRVVWPFFCAAAWVAMEMARARLYTGFPWDFLGVSQFRFLALIQISSLTGVYGVSFLVAWLSSALFLAVSPGRAFWPLAPPLAAVVAAVVFGFAKLSQAPSETAPFLQMALVQPDIPQPAIWDATDKSNRFVQLLELSRAALATKPDILVWPEAPLPDLLGRNGYTQRAVTGLLQGGRAWMVMGAADTRGSPHGPQPFQAFNSAFLIDPNGNLVDRYYKRHLVPFSEYLPWAREFPFLARSRRSGAGLSHGDKPVQFHLHHPPATFAPLICFEDTFSQEVRQTVAPSTDFLLDLTNDGWLGHGSAQWQHATSALFRAVENGLPLVRCANNGLTCWIDTRGRMHNVYFDDSLDICQAGFKIARVPLAPAAPTFYRRHGDIFGWTCVAITALLLLFHAPSRKPQAI
jgi:apolipoprotein N-acyltransferase